MSIRKDAIDAMVHKCNTELNYQDIVNECTETINYRLIVELILDTIVSVWADDKKQLRQR